MCSVSQLQPASQLQIRIRHRAERGARDVSGVFRQHAARVAGRAGEIRGARHQRVGRRGDG